MRLVFLTLCQQLLAVNSFTSREGYQPVLQMFGGAKKCWLLRFFIIHMFLNQLWRFNNNYLYGIFFVHSLYLSDVILYQTDRSERNIEFWVTGVIWCDIPAAVSTHNSLGLFNATLYILFLYVDLFKFVNSYETTGSHCRTYISIIMSNYVTKMQIRSLNFYLFYVIVFEALKFQ